MIILSEENKAQTISFELERKTGKNKTLAKGNQMISSNDRMHFIVKSQITEYLRTLANNKITQEVEDIDAIQYTLENTCVIMVTVYPPSNRRMDPPNWYPTVKALIDGMTDAGLWEDDNGEIIKFIAFKSGPKTSNKKYKIEMDIYTNTEETDE